MMHRLLKYDPPTCIYERPFLAYQENWAKVGRPSGPHRCLLI